MSKNIVILSLLLLIVGLVFLIRSSHEGFIPFVEKLEKSAGIIDHKKEEDKEIHVDNKEQEEKEQDTKEQEDKEVHDDKSSWEDHNTYFPPKCIERMMKRPPKCIIDNYHIKEPVPLLAEGFPVSLMKVKKDSNLKDHKFNEDEFDEEHKRSLEKLNVPSNIKNLGHYEINLLHTFIN